MTDYHMARAVTSAALEESVGARDGARERESERARTHEREGGREREKDTVEGEMYVYCLWDGWEAYYVLASVKLIARAACPCLCCCRELEKLEPSL